MPLLFFRCHFCYFRKQKEIKKILKVYYLHGKATEYRPAGYINFILAEKPKLKLSQFHPTVSSSTDISIEFQERIYETPRQSSWKYLIKWFFRFNKLGRLVFDAKRHKKILNLKAFEQLVILIRN